MQKIFRSRVRRFMDAKKFETRGGMPLTDEMQVLVSASAIELTFGLSNFLFHHFNTIILYPEKYKSEITGKIHKGEVHLKGAIVLSWRDFVAGYSNLSDNINLGLHEFAHALYLSFKMNKYYDPAFDYYYNQWKKEGEKVFESMQQERLPYLNDYAKTNPIEFFAVAVEHFFETPHEFSRKLPRLYTCLSKMLSQNPAVLAHKTIESQ